MKTDLEEIKKISITEYARQMGFTPVKIGSYYTLKEHDLKVFRAVKQSNFYVMR